MKELDFGLQDYVKIKGERGSKSSGKVHRIEGDARYGAIVTVVVNGQFHTYTADNLEPLTTLILKPGNKRRTRKRVTALGGRDKR